ncbi:uncharacterized protein [Watersipora subatra]|uniref:uncharacterized protein n=1 Tax=Watersipora subatra TaxID=2589382 RepID=UPI00355AFD54
MPDEQRFPCFVCNESFAEKWEHHEHIHSYSHQKKVSAKGRNTRHTCICCQTTLNSIVEYADHIGTEGHIEALKEKIAGMKNWEANEKRNRSNMQRPAKRQPHHRQNQNWNRWDLQPRGYRKWEHQRSSGSDNYIDLNANSGRSNATHDNDERNWKYPFGFQYPYNQPTPYNNHINYHHRNPALASAHQHPNSQQPFSATPSTSNSYSSNAFVSSSSSLNANTDSHSVQSTTGVHDFMDRKVSEQSLSLEGSIVAQSPCASLGHNPRSIRSASQVISPVGSSAAPEPSYKNRSAEQKEQCSIFSNASPTRPVASSDKSSKPSSRPTTPVGVNFQASAAKQTSDYDSSKKSSKNLRASTSSDKSAQVKGERAAKSASRSADSSVVGSSIGDSNIASSKELSVNPPVASISGETLRKVKKEPGNDLQTDRLSNNNNKIKKKQGNLQGLLQGRSSSRHLQYQLDKAVKMRRTVQGRNYNIENEAIASGFPDSCELESLKEGDAGEIEALLEGVEGPFQDQANQSADATSSTSYQESSTLPMIGKRRSIDQQTAATSDGTSGTVNPNSGIKTSAYLTIISFFILLSKSKRQRQTETAGPSPVLKQTKKLKKTALPTNLSIKSRKVIILVPELLIQKKAKTVTPQKQQKTLKASGKQNAVGKTKVKKTSTKTAGVSDELRQSAEVSPEESSSFPAKTQTEEESVISQLLVITVREEKIRQELPTLEDSINAMTAKKKNLLEELKKLEEEIQSAKVMRDLMNEEECNIRKSRLDILTKAKRTNLKASTVIQQADTTSTISDQPLNTQYLGGFITSGSSISWLSNEPLFDMVRQTLTQLTSKKLFLNCKKEFNICRKGRMETQSRGRVTHPPKG